MLIHKTRYDFLKSPKHHKNGCKIILKLKFKNLVLWNVELIDSIYKLIFYKHVKLDTKKFKIKNIEIATYLWLFS